MLIINELFKKISILDLGEKKIKNDHNWSQPAILRFAYSVNSGAHRFTSVEDMPL